MFLPVFVYYVIFCYLPMYGIVIAFQDFRPGMDFFENAKWVGFMHFRNFLSSPIALKVIKNTIMLNLWELAFGFPAPIILALLLNEIRVSWFKRTVQTISYLPHFVALVVIIGIVKDVVSTEGLINTLRLYIHQWMGNDPSTFKPIVFLNQPQYFRPIYVFSGIWQGVGWGSILYIANLASIDPTLYEAAEIDGAGRFRKMFNITIPGIMPTITIMLIFAIGGLLSSGFEKLILLYQPLTYEVADTIGTYMYRVGLEEAKYSLSAAVSLFSTVINFGLLVGVNKLAAKVSENSLW
ncbi:MAG TPA: sugar ABC transporter permease [Clostridiales bacterium]|nr:sugar ABC transporter permease [Clostridiales bacterium]